MNYHKLETASIGNGPGFRVVLWLSGCSHHCPGCQNPETHDPAGGRHFGNAAFRQLLHALSNPWIDGLTLSGGDPFYHGNLAAVRSLLSEIRKWFPQKSIWVYTGDTLQLSDFLRQAPGMATADDRHAILQMADVVVDGMYLEPARDLTLAFRGSRNQRLIDCKATIASGRLITLEEEA